MAIAFDAYSSGGASTTSLTISHTTSTGDDRLMIVGVWDASSNDVTGVTYNSVSLTQIGSSVQVGGSGEYVSLWYLIAPATGANDVVISQTGTSDLHGRVLTYTGCDQTSPIGGSGTDSDASDTSVDVSITVDEDTSWVVMHNRGQSSSSGDNFSGLTTRNHTTGSSINIGDSNGTVSSGAGTATYTAGAADDWGGIGCEIKVVSVASANGLAMCNF